MPKYVLVIISLFVAILVGLGVWWLVAAQPAGAPATNQTTQTPQGEQSQSPNNPSSTTIVFNNNGFEQQNYTVTAGQTVTVKNLSSIAVEFSSDEHPVHTDNPELNLQPLQPGEEANFTPENPGTWGIHDHEHPEFTTTLTVTE